LDQLSLGYGGFEMKKVILLVCLLVWFGVWMDSLAIETSVSAETNISAALLIAKDLMEHSNGLEYIGESDEPVQVFIWPRKTQNWSFETDQEWINYVQQMVTPWDDYPEPKLIDQDKFWDYWMTYYSEGGGYHSEEKEKKLQMLKHDFECMNHVRAYRVENPGEYSGSQRILFGEAGPDWFVGIKVMVRES
jgi:hypothetical protein